MYCRIDLMKKAYLISLIIFVLIAMSGIALLAQSSVDDRGNANDPSTNPRANVCYAGGSLAGKCDAEWKWVCGWGIARVEAGMLNRAVLASECQGLMPVLEPTYTPRAKVNVTEDVSPPTPTKKPL
jgi:hypothetical protein